MGAPDARKPLIDSGEIQRLHEALCEVMQQEFLGQWLQTPNDALGGLKPAEAIKNGEIERLWRIVYFLQSGQPG